MAFGQPNNYYSNPYGGYGYAAPNYSMPQYMQPTTVPSVQQQVQQPTPQISQTSSSYPMIYGKIAENFDIVKVSEIPIGGYGVFPLADSSKVYIKMYDKDGNPQLYTYELSKGKELKQDDIYSDKLNEIYEYLARLDKKIDDIKPSSSTSTRKKKVEVNEDDE